MDRPPNVGAPTAVTFDLWHTLVYLEPEEEEGYIRHQLDMAAELLSAAPADRGRSPTPDAARAAFQAERNSAILAAARGESRSLAAQFDSAARRLGIRADPREYLDRLRAELDVTPFRAAPGAVELLSDLHERGVRIGVVSNTIGEPGAFLRPLLRRLGLAGQVGAWTFSDEHAWTKPSPALFRACLARLGASASRAAHVGDGWMDLEGARRASYRAVVLFTGLQRYAPSYRAFVTDAGRRAVSADFRLPRLEELPGVLRRAGLLDREA